MSRKSLHREYEGNGMRKRATKRSSLRFTLKVLRRRLAADQQGATAIEYALVAAGVGAAVAATVYHLGSTTAGLYSHLSF